MWMFRKVGRVRHSIPKTQDPLHSGAGCYLEIALENEMRISDIVESDEEGKANMRSAIFHGRVCSKLTAFGEYCPPDRVAQLQKPVSAHPLAQITKNARLCIYLEIQIVLRWRRNTRKADAAARKVMGK